MTRILIADDHEIVRRGLKDLLTDAYPKLKTGEAKNFQEVFDLADKQPWDVVLM